MRARRTRVCRWCLQPLPEWTDIWPHEPGVYLFYGYPFNKNVDGQPRCVLVTVETHFQTSGTVYRTTHSTLKKRTGAIGFFMPLMVPAELPAQSDIEEMGDKAAEASAKLRIKKLKRYGKRRMP